MGPPIAGAALNGTGLLVVADSGGAVANSGGAGLTGTALALAEDCWRSSLQGGLGGIVLAAADCEGIPKDGAGDIELVL